MCDKQDIAAGAPCQLVRGLGLIDATMIVAGSMIGSGIFIVSADMARQLGSAGWLFVAWLLSGLLTVFAALSYGELAAMMPLAGGQYVYLRESYNPLCGFLYGWTLFLVIQTGTIAAVAVAFAKFLGVLAPAISESQKLAQWGRFSISPTSLVAIGVLVLLTWSNSTGLRTGKRVQNFFTFTKIAALALLIGLGCALGAHSGTLRANFADLWSASFTQPPGTQGSAPAAFPLAGLGLMAAIGTAMVGSLFSSDAWNNVTFTAGEVKDPKRNLPLSLLLGVGLVCLLYVLANVAYLVALPLKGSPSGATVLERGMQFAADNRVGTAAAEVIFGARGAVVMAILVMVSTFGCLNGMILAGARVYYAMARDGLFFAGVGRLNRRAVPRNGLAIQCAWAVLLTLSGTYGDLLDYVIFAALLFYVLTIIGLFVLRWKRPADERPYHAFGYPVVPAVYVIVASLIALDLLVSAKTRANTLPGLVIVLSGIPAYLLWQRKLRTMRTALHLAAFGVVLSAWAGPGDTTGTIVVTNDLSLDSGARLPARMIVRASHVTIDGNGATLIGPGRTGDMKSLEDAGAGILIEGATCVTLRDLRAHGFATGLVVRWASAVTIEECDFSDNYHNPTHGWGELPARGGVLMEGVRQSVVRKNRANRVWDGIHLVDSDDNLVSENDFSECSNTCAKLWKSSRNKFLSNNLSYGIRIDRAAGEVHARDSTCVLIETGSDDNYWYRNDITHGGDGVFIRPLNRWVSRGNVFVENDTSHANNNCVESWSPGNVFIRNKANHGSYGFWLGGSDQTVLIGNEAAFNGLTNGWHNAPEPGFGHGGIVIVGGPSSHTLIDGNNLHDNNGAGIAFRGDVASKGRQWRTEHWVVQRNRIVNNRFGIWGRWGNAITLAGNILANNTLGNVLEDVTNLIELAEAPAALTTPTVVIVGPDVAVIGRPVRFDASPSGDPGGAPLQFQWWLDDPAGTQAWIEPTFDKAGFYRLGLTAHNGSSAALAWRDLTVVNPVTLELGTEGQAARWGFELELNDSGKGRVLFVDDLPGVVGAQCLRFSPNPYPGAYATAIYPATRDAGWDFSNNLRLSFWIKARNPNTPGYQNAGPVVRLIGRGGHIEYKPAKEANLLNDPPCSEARWLWMHIQVPLNGDPAWQRSVTGAVELNRIDAISLALDSWGGDPFTVWLDGLTVE